MESAARVRSELQRGAHDPRALRAALSAVAPADRDAWVNALLGLGELPEDGPSLPRDGVPYLPCAVDALLRAVDQASVGPLDVFVDVGSGVGRATALVHLLTGARAVGVEIQPALVLAARDLARRLRLARVSTLEGDAAELAPGVAGASIFFLYCPFSGPRLERLLGRLEPIARRRAVRVCCVDLPLPPCPWLALEPPRSGDLAIYRAV